MMTEKTARRVEPGLKIKVLGIRTETVGTFQGVGITEEGKPRVILGVEDSTIPFAYEFDEIRRIEVIG